LIALATCDSLFLLEAIFGTVLVTEAVLFEVMTIDDLLG
jgi:predicted nucleic acid-binding protein